MKIEVSEEAANWYKEELDINTGNIRFFVRYGGIGGRIPGFSLGIKLEQPIEVHSFTVVEDLFFFIEEKDAWYFEDADMAVQLEQGKTDPEPAPSISYD